MHSSKNILFLLLILFSLKTFSQGQTLPPRTENGGILLFEKGRFIQDGQRLTLKQAVEATRMNPAAYEEMQAAKSNSDMATIVGAAGGFLIGWPLGTAAAGGDPNWAMMGIGAGLVAISIPFALSFKKHAVRGTELHNSGVTGRYQSDLKLNLAVHSVGMKLSF